MPSVSKHGECVHCKKPGIVVARDLCWKCTRSGTIRAKYPLTNKHVREHPIKKELADCERAERLSHAMSLLRCGIRDGISRETIAELVELDLVTIDECGKIAVCEWWKRETVKFFKDARWS